MAIPNSRLETWSKQGSKDASSATYQSVQNALVGNNSPIRDLITSSKVRVYLQGSYANDTNTRGDSDVDVIVELMQTFHSNKLELPSDQYAAHEQTYNTADYQWRAFRDHVLTALEKYYGSVLIDKSGNKSLKVLPNSGRLRADVVPVTAYRKYVYFISDGNHEKEVGVHFYHLATNRGIVNFPDQHYKNGVAKHQATKNEFKGVVRTLKNARSYLVDKNLLDKDKAPSYFLQSLIYNIPDHLFVGDRTTIIRNCLHYLYNTDISEFKAQNGQHSLFDENSEELWNIPHAQDAITALVNLWDNWSTI